jgi:peptidyl-prolyl cis-trans isomerase D
LRPRPPLRRGLPLRYYPPVSRNWKFEMLQGFRAGSRNLFTKIVLFILMGLLIISFMFWGIGDVFRGFGAGSVARVGSTEISIDHFRRAFTERLQQIGRQINRPFTPDQARALGIDRQVLGDLVSDAAVDQKARALGLAVTMEIIADRVRDYPGFKGPDGKFDPRRYQAILRENNYSEATYLAAERRLALRQQLLSALGADSPPPAVLVDAFWRLSNEARSIDFVRLTAAQAGNVPAPTEADLKTYFEANKAGFRAPEYRTLRIIRLSPADVAKTITITDDELRKFYDSNKQRFTIPERRTIDQIAFPTADVAKTAADRLAKGEKFEAVAKDLKLDVVALGNLARSEVFDPIVGDAAFTLAANTTSAPLAAQFGAIIVRVTKIEPTRILPFEEVSKALRDDLALNRAFDETRKLHDKVEDERGGGANLEEISKKLNVPLSTVEVDRSGRRPDGQPVVDIPQLDVILNNAFSVAKNVETDAIELRESRSTVWYDVADIKPSRERTFEEAKADAEKRWKEEQIGKKLIELASAIQKKLDEGATFAAAAPYLRVEKAEGIKRGGTVPGVDANTIARVFLTAQNKSGLGNPENSVDRIVFRVVKIELPATAPSSQLIQQITQSIQEDLQTQYINRLTNDLGYRVNENAFRQVTGATER